MLRSLSILRSAHLVLAVSVIGFICGEAMADPVIKTSPGTFSLTVSPFTMGALHYPGGEIDALPAREQLLVLNPRTLRLHTLLRSFGDGEIVLARVTTGDSSVLSVDPSKSAQSATRIPRALEKLSRGESLSVGCLGTSLVENGCGAEGWQRLLFPDSFLEAKPPTAVPADDELARLLRIPGKIIDTSYAVGGTNSRYTVALVGEGIADGRPLRTSVFDHDLVIVALLPNGGIDRLAVYESVVRRLRDHGIEVLLLTDNAFAKKVPDGLWGNGEFVRRLADRYDCGVADTAAYMAEGELRGEKVYRDAIHQAAAGNICWAEAIVSVLAPALPPLAAVPSSREPAMIESPDKIPYNTLVEFTPQSEGAKLSDQPADNRVAKAFGLPGSRCLEYPVGASLAFGDPRMIAADLVVAVNSEFNAELRTSDGRFIRNIIQHRPVGEPQPWMRRPNTVNLLTPANFQGPDSPHSFRLSITDGTLLLHAVSMQLGAP